MKLKTIKSLQNIQEKKKKYQDEIWKIKKSKI
jgi:hypothetical protein